MAFLRKCTLRPKPESAGEMIIFMFTANREAENIAHTVSRQTFPTYPIRKSRKSDCYVSATTVQTSSDSLALYPSATLASGFLLNVPPVIEIFA